MLTDEVYHETAIATPASRLAEESLTGRPWTQEECCGCSSDVGVRVAEVVYGLIDYIEAGIFTSSIYAEDCIFEDPTIKFRGTDLYERNVKLLVPFFDGASIELEKIEKVSLRIDAEAGYILATWKLRTYLKLPWKPLISIDGSTVYEIDDKFQIVRHAESWNVSALEAVGQIFIPSSGVLSE